MPLFANSISITRYKVSGVLEGSINDKILNALNQNSIDVIVNEDTSKRMGWTSLEKPYQPYFDDFSFVYANYLSFALRIDKKNIPPKLIKQQVTVECEKKLDEEHREFLSAKEKKDIREHVTSVLGMRIPAVPDIYELVWQHESQNLYFFTTLKSANEDLEHLFSHSFGLKLIRLFPYTYATILSGLKDAEQDLFNNIQPSNFTGF